MPKKQHSLRKPWHGVVFARFGTVSMRMTTTTVELVLELAAELVVGANERRDVKIVATAIALTVLYFRIRTLTYRCTSMYVVFMRPARKFDLEWS